ncbi:MAG: beta family protein, partial [Planctomycetaceae bacterium]|nr:beta family protein [Planctomycetaceae bacterium]
HKHYVPVLKGKRGEFPAIQHITNKAGVTPLIEHVPTQVADFVPSKMDSVWPHELPYFIDMVFADDEDSPAEAADTHPITVAFAAAASQHAIPVTGPTRSPAYQEAVRKIVASQRRGYAVRLLVEDFEDDEAMAAWIDAILDFMEVSIGEVDLIVDLDSVAGQPAAVVSRECLTLLSMVPRLSEWRTTTVVGAAFPAGLSPLARGWNTLPRNDWLGWNGVISRPRTLTRLPTYGDYAISSPDLPPSGRATILAQLRYTTPDEFLVYKGSNVFAHPRKFHQFYDICALLVARPEFRGANFSFGDGLIAAKAANQGSSGSAETWRTIGVSHHVETVLDQIANLP